MCKLFLEREELKVVDNQAGSPTWSRAIAEATALAVSKSLRDGQSDIYHMAGPGRLLVRLRLGHPRAEHVPSELVVKSILLVTSSPNPTKAVWSLNSRLDCDKLENDFGLRLHSLRT